MHARDLRDRRDLLDMDDPAVHPLRRLLFTVVAVGALGLIAELLLLEHTESVYQWIPLIVLFLAAPLAAILAFRPTRGLLRAFQVLMGISLVAGGLGIYLHYRGNTEFELEMDPALHGLDLFWSALRGATPALAPGAMAQLGLIGLIAVFRHPNLRRPA